MNNFNNFSISTDQINELSEHGYSIVRKAVDPVLIDIFENYVLMQRFNNYYLDDETTKSKWRYSDVFGESILVHLQPLMEKIAGCQLYPTNSVLRIYQKGGILKKHIDRPTCEFSATVTIGYDSKEPYPIWIERDKKNIPVILDRGDLLVYKGCEVPHWREEFKGRHWIQLFLHYVNSQGEYSRFKNDGRLMVGMTEGKILTRKQPK